MFLVCVNQGAMYVHTYIHICMRIVRDFVIDNSTDRRPQGPQPGGFRTHIPASDHRLSNGGLGVGLTPDPSSSQARDEWCCIKTLHICQCRQNRHQCLENVGVSSKVSERAGIVSEKTRIVSLEAPLPGDFGCQAKRACFAAGEPPPQG
jgi:hypothetical protein